MGDEPEDGEEGTEESSIWGGIKGFLFFNLILFILLTNF